MKKATVLMMAALSLTACNNAGDNGENPSAVHPPSEAIPDSTKLVNDSVIVPDTVPGNGAQVGQSDSIRQ